MGRIHTSTARAFDVSSELTLATLASRDPATGPVTLTVADLGAGYAWDDPNQTEIVKGAATLADIHVQLYSHGVGGGTMTVQFAQDDVFTTPMTWGVFDLSAGTREVGEHVVPIYNHLGDTVYRYVRLVMSAADVLIESTVRKRHA